MIFSIIVSLLFQYNQINCIAENPKHNVLVTIKAFILNYALYWK